VTHVWPAPPGHCLGRPTFNAARTDAAIEHKTKPYPAMSSTSSRPTARRRHPSPLKSLNLLALALAGLGTSVQAQQQQPAQATGQAGVLEPVVVTGSTGERKLVDAPYAITAVGAAELRSSGPQVNLSEALVRVPGLTVANRSNYAQDLQISSRGFGARAGFGVRGLRLYADGIPATMPDGQGQVAHFDLAGAQRVEVLRGPYSALYGNSSGGVIALFSAPVNEAASDVSVDFGSFGLRQQRLALAAPVGEHLDLSASLSRFEIDGFRPHSAATRQLANVRASIDSDDDRVVLQLSDQNQQADDPLGLNSTDLQKGPRTTASQADTNQTRKTIRQTQVGAAWTHQLGLGGLDSFSLTAYGGSRGVSQFLAIPATTQNDNRHGGGLIDFDRIYSGLDARLKGRAASVDWVAGASADEMVDDRRGYLSFSGTVAAPNYGVQGTPKRDERNVARSRDVYGQAEWAATPEFSTTLGLRTGRVRLTTADHFTSPSANPLQVNGDDSGQLKFSYTTPVLGFKLKLAPTLTAHLAASRGFESPTLGELAYKTSSGGGFNTTLQPQTSQQQEAGIKWRPGAGLPDVDLTGFNIRTSNEIGVLTNAGGRASFQNVGRTSRTGLELGSRLQLSASVSARLALTQLEAKYKDNFKTCPASPPCTSASVDVVAGNRIAGTQPTSGYAELAWRALPGGELGIELRGQGRTAVNDQNSDFASGFGLVNLRWSQSWDLGAADRVEFLARVDNIADRAYVGSVIVNDGNGRYYEPGAPRNLLASLRWHHGW
jgi:iron complex outermembrane receptor protein